MLGKTNAIKTTVAAGTIVVDDYFVPLGTSSTNLSRSYTIPEDGLYFIHAAINSNGPTTSGNLSIRCTFTVPATSFAAPQSLTFQSVSSFSSTYQAGSQRIPLFRYLKAGTVVTIAMSASGGQGAYGFNTKNLNSVQIIKAECSLDTAFEFYNDVARQN